MVVKAVADTDLGSGIMQAANPVRQPSAHEHPQGKAQSLPVASSLRPGPFSSGTEESIGHSAVTFTKQQSAYTLFIGKAQLSAGQPQRTNIALLRG